MAEEVVDAIRKSRIWELIRLSRSLWITYDPETDVLYLAFKKPERATESVMRGNYIIRKEGDRVVGVTVLEASSELGSEGSGKPETARG